MAKYKILRLKKLTKAVSLALFGDWRPRWLRNYM